MELTITQIASIGAIILFCEKYLLARFMNFVKLYIDILLLVD